MIPIKKRYVKVWLSGPHINCGAILDQKTGRLSTPYTGIILDRLDIEEEIVACDWNYNIRDFDRIGVRFTILDDDLDIDTQMKLLFLSRW